MGTNHIESSLKRFFKRKVKVTLGLVVAFMITGTVGFAETINITEANEYEVLVRQGQNAVKSTQTIGLTTKNEKYKDGEIKDNLNINLSGQYNYAVNGIHLETTEKGNNTSAEKLVLTGDEINIKIKNTGLNNTNGIMNSTGGNLTLGNENSIINIDVEGGYGTGQVVGISTTGNSDRVTGNTIGKFGGTTVVNGKELNIKAVSEKADLLVGISVNNETTHDNETVQEGTMSNMTINAEKTTIFLENKNGKWATGISVYSNGTLDINGDLEVIVKDSKTLDERTAIGVRYNSITKVNEDKKHTIKLDGNILFDYNGADDVNKETDLTLNLSNSESYLTGKIYKADNQIPDGSQGHGMKLGVSNGGAWNVTGDSFVNDFTFDSGIVNVLNNENEENGTEIKIDNLHGNGGTVTFETEVAENGDISVAQGNLNIKEVEGAPRMRVGFSGTNADELIGKNVNLEEAFNQLADKVTVTTGNVEETYFAQEGAVVGEITANKDGDKLNISQEKSSNTVAGLRDLATINYLSWKQEMGSLTQRMGELRNSSAEHGVWARVYGGKVENGSRYDNEYQTYQVGYDKKYSINNGNVFLGYLVSYTDGETNYELGSGENYSVGAGMYATWMNNNGHYVDVLYKVSRLNNKFDVNGRGNNLNSKGEYDTYGISLSGEYGKRFDLTEKWFIEPNVGMHFGRLGDETYTTNSGIEVSQDSIYTAEGRIGTSVGYKFGNGNVYARAHAVKEFAGDIDSSYTANGVTVKESEDLSDTWLEFGVGTNYRFAENVNVYLDLEKSGNAAVDTEWQANLGFRWEF